MRTPKIGRRARNAMRWCTESSGRRIVVNGIEYRWKAGISMIEIRREGRVVLRTDTARALGMSNSDHERAIRKRASNCAVTPALVAELIRATSKVA